MPRNTMSLDAADIDNDGRLELFSADMKPYEDDAATRAAWQTLSQNYDALPADDPQIEENVLLVGNVAEGFENRATDSGVDASGWSWSAKFADLDNDGLQDLYVVNGMYSEATFGHLPDAELIEQNDPNRVHFGYPDSAELGRLEIVWPDGAHSTLPAPATNALLTVQRMRR